MNVSRPFLIRLLEEGRIKFHKVGTHRRVRFADLAAFKARAQEESEKALAELAAEGQDLFANTPRASTDFLSERAQPMAGEHKPR